MLAMTSRTPKSLREARCRFTGAIAALIIQANDQGYEIALAEGMDRLTVKDPTSDHRVGSLHDIGLAQDMDLYRGGVYLNETSDHLGLGEWWEAYGVERDWPLKWGGRFTTPDGNHYSWGWNGRR